MADGDANEGAAWQAFLGDKLKPWRGQAKLWNAAATESKGAKWLCVLPTGYGKTITAIGAFSILRKRGLATHMLVLVSTDQQRDQWVKGAKKYFDRLGEPLRGALRIEKKDREYRYALPGMCEVFVGTYAQLLNGAAYWDLLMQYGQWMVVFDECHHLYEDGAWTRASTVLRCDFELYLSATIIRTDKKPLREGIPIKQTQEGAWEFEPTSHINVMQALKEGAIRWPVLHKHHYFVDVIKADGTNERLTTDSLSPEARKDFEGYETRYQLRYREEYLSSMLLDAVAELSARNIRHPNQHQMLIFAMTCKHAVFVTGLLNKLVGSNFADCIGIHRSDEQNRSVLDRYLSNELQCLVQVEKAGEGFDNPRSSVLVFLNLVQALSKVIQQVGRGQRRNHAIPADQDTAAVFASADSAVALYLQAIEMEETDEVIRERVKRDSDPGQPSAPRMVDLPSLHVIAAEFDRAERFGPDPQTIDDIRRGEEIAKEVGLHGLTQDMLAKLGRSASRERVTPSAQFLASETAAIEYWRDKVDRGVKTLAGNAARAGGRTEIEGKSFGRLIHAIHSEWMRVSGMGHDAMTAADMQRKYEWVRGINDTLVNEGRAPAWLT
jgi:superfamily II DNA or RNA helicase